MFRTLVLFAAVAACGNKDKVRHLDGGSDTDDGSFDGGPDGPPVTLTVTYNGAPQMGVRVYFQNADSSLVASTMTDATGTASAAMNPGGFVTAVDAVPPPIGTTVSDVLSTFAGVKPGDHLVLGRDDRGSETVINVIAPIDAAQPTMYSAYTPCGSNTLTAGPMSATGPLILENCGATTDVLIVTTDGAGKVLHSIYKSGVDATMAIDLHAATYAAPMTRTYKYDNTPTAPRTIGVHDAFARPQGGLFEGVTSPALNNGPPTMTTMSLPIVAGATDVVTTVDFPPNVSSFRTFIDWGAYSSMFHVDFAAHLVPDIVAFPTYDVASHSASWTETAGTLQPDLIVLEIDAARPSDGRSWAWHVAAPHATTVALPTLPTDFYDFSIAATDSSRLVQLVSAKVPGGYDAVRAQILSVADPRGFVGGPTGSISMTTVTNPGLRRH